MHFAASPAGTLAGAAFTALLAVACVSDLRSRRIPNSLVATLALAGLFHATLTRDVFGAVAFAGSGMAIGLALWLPFWAARVLGAGDVKLAGAVGAWLGISGVVEASLLAAVAGGVLAVWALIRDEGVMAGMSRFGVWMVASRVRRGIAPEFTPAERRLPYGLAIAAGSVTAAWLPGLLW
jgi:prepilin peptidase CpaA